ncbi:MAG: LuxR C-terminal-related transcriptional regulator [Paracoccaceae bacterium]|nr:LuxR C-terminal-related transcriptional regulator [Paracoccaceae bacterium]
MEFIDEIGAAADPGEVVRRLHRAVARHDIAHVSYLATRDGSNPSGFSTTPPEWISHYQGGDYWKLDPASRIPEHDFTPVARAFDDRHPSFDFSGMTREIHYEMREFDVLGTYYLRQPGPEPGSIAAVNFLTTVPWERYDDWLADKAPTLRMMAAAVHVRMAEFDGLGGAGPGSCNVVSVDPDTGELAPRERETLQWFAEGLRAEGVAERMGISPRTVEFHVRNARKRLDARTREEAVAKAIRRRLI